jgi:hypothetical protein
MVRTGGGVATTGGRTHIWDEECLIMTRKEQDMREIEIAAYLEGRLTGAAREALERRFENDREGREALALAKGALQDTGDAGDVPESLERRARDLYPQGRDIVDLVVSLVGKTIKVLSASPGTDIMSPAQMGMVRGSDATGELLMVAFRSFKQGRVYVHVENIGRKLCQFTVQARDPFRDMPLENARVDLVSSWRELASNPLEAGTTQFEGVGPGQYDLVVRKNETIVGKMTIQIAGT